MRVKYSYLEEQFKNPDYILRDLEKLVKRGDFTLGKEVEIFEKRFAQLASAKFAVGVSSGTAALLLGLQAVGVGHDDEVITAPNTFFASVNAIAAVGAKPVFVDVGEDYNINSELIENAINERTKAIMPVHLTGRPAAMNEIVDIARKHGLKVIEDAAQAIGANYRGRRTGSLGDVGCFSTHPLKTLHTAGDGGFITTDSQEIYERIIKLRNHGLKNREESEFFGYNSRLDEIHAAILNTQLEYVEIWNKQRRDIALRYSSELSPIVDTPEEKSYEESSYHTFVIQAKNRDSLRLHLSNMGIETKIHYPIPIHLQQAAKYLGYRSGAFPVAERQSSQILSLPVYPELTSKQIEKVIEGVTSFYK